MFRLEPSSISSVYIRKAIYAVYKKAWPVYKELKKEAGDKIFDEFRVKENNQILNNSINFIWLIY